MARVVYKYLVAVHLYFSDLTFFSLLRFDLVELGTHVIERLQALTSKVTQLQTLHISDTELVLVYIIIHSCVCVLYGISC